MQKWAAWMGELAKQGKLVSSQPLESDSGRLVRPGKRPATDGPFIEGKEIAWPGTRPSTSSAGSGIWSPSISATAGAAEALRELHDISEQPGLRSLPLYHALLGEIHLGLGDREQARMGFETAAGMTQS